MTRARSHHHSLNWIRVKKSLSDWLEIKYAMNKSSATPNISSPSVRPLRISIEGNIGSGKSTCLKYFSQFENIEIHTEPIDKWRNVNGHNLFANLYTDLTKWNFAFQHYVQLTRLQNQTSLPKSNKTDVVMFERSLQNNRYCFVENAYRNNLLKECEYNIIACWYDYIKSDMDINLDLIVYLRSSPDIVWHRMVKRGRSEETTVPLSYLRQIHASYEIWLNTPEQVDCPIITIDADKDLEDVIKQLEENTPRIMGGNIKMNKTAS